MQRHIRYQGVILRDHYILLISHREHLSGRVYWLLPGGGIDPGETEEACVAREMKEETGLDVRIERLLLEGASLPGDIYQWLKSFLCTPLSNVDPQPGFEPEAEAAASYRIDAVAWYDLREPDSWGEVLHHPWTHSQLLQIRAVLGYS